MEAFSRIEDGWDTASVDIKLGSFNTKYPDVEDDGKNPPAFLICPVCIDILKSPKLLPCSHTICYTCVTSIISSQDRTPEEITSPKKSVYFRVDCPVCRARIAIPRLEDIANNLAISDAVAVWEAKASKRRTSGVVKKIWLCKAHNIAADRWCMDCKENMCSSCVQQDPHSGHAITNIKSYDRYCKRQAELVHMVAEIKTKYKDVKTLKTHLKTQEELLRVQGAESLAEFSLFVDDVFCALLVKILLVVRNMSRIYKEVKKTMKTDEAELVKSSKAMLQFFEDVENVNKNTPVGQPNIPKELLAKFKELSNYTPSRRDPTRKFEDETSIAIEDLLMMKSKIKRFTVRKVLSSIHHPPVRIPPDETTRALGVVFTRNAANAAEEELDAADAYEDQQDSDTDDGSADSQSVDAGMDGYSEATVNLLQSLLSEIRAPSPSGSEEGQSETRRSVSSSGIVLDGMEESVSGHVEEHAESTQGDDRGELTSNTDEAVAEDPPDPHEEIFAIHVGPDHDSDDSNSEAELFAASVEEELEILRRRFARRRGRIVGMLPRVQRRRRWTADGTIINQSQAFGEGATPTTEQGELITAPHGEPSSQQSTATEAPPTSNPTDEGNDNQAAPMGRARGFLSRLVLRRRRSQNDENTNNSNISAVGDEQES